MAKRKQSGVQIRPAIVNDIDGIMDVEKQTFEPIGLGATASKATMIDRIVLCNETYRQSDSDPRWFWIAEQDGNILGYLILQPTNLFPPQCTSWNQATDNGTLQETFNYTGSNIYVVSFAALEKAPAGVSPLLAHAGFVQWLNSRKKHFMFCSRMPGFRERHRKSGINAHEYWRLTRKDGSPQDGMLHLYWEMTGGARPLCLLKEGFAVDKDSGGHGVLFAANDPQAALLAIGQRIYESGLADRGAR